LLHVPYVIKPQQIVEKMSQEDYSIIIFGDKNHPEIKGVVSYAKDRDNAFIILRKEELEELPLKSKVAVVAQTTRKPADFLEIVNSLILKLRG